MKIILDPLGDAVELTAEDDLKRYRIEKVHTAVGELQATLAGKFNTVRPYVARKARFDVEINGSVEFNGFLLDAEENVETGSVTLQGAGIANRLEETRPDYDNLGGSLTYSDITVEDAIEDYWTRTPFFSGNITVHPQPTESVATDAQTQFADANTQFNNLLSVPDTEPFIVQSGELQLAQTNFFIEAEDAVFTGTQIGTADTGVDYSNAQAVRLGANGDEVTDSKVFDYDIPSGEATFRARAELNNLDSEVSLQLDGTEIRDLSFGGQSDSISWRFGLGSTAPALSAGSHSFTIELKNYNSGNIEIDCVSFRDDRFSYTEDNTVDTQFNTLSGPELFPAGRQQAFDEALVSYNITDTTVDVTEAEGETINQLAVSSDDGTTFQTVTGTNSNTFAVSDDTRSVIPRLELGRYQFNATTSPDTGDGGHAIDVYELLTSGNNLTVIDELKLSRNHYQNIKELHEYGDYLWVIKHQSGGIALQEIESFEEGDQSRPKVEGFDDPLNQSSGVSAQRYYNAIYLQGAEDANGDRPVADVQDSNLVSNDGREISPGVLRDPKITTDAGAAFKARSLLGAASDNNVLVGSVTVPPTITDPGFARPINFGAGEDEKTVERVTITESNDEAQATFEFSTVEDIAREISELQANVGAIGDRV